MAGKTAAQVKGYWKKFIQDRSCRRGRLIKRDAEGAQLETNGSDGVKREKPDKTEE